MANIKLLSQLQELAKYIIHHHDFLYMTSDQGTHFTTKEVRQQAHAHRISCPYLVRSNRSRRRLSGTAFGRPIWHQLGNSIKKFWGSILQNAVYTLNQQPIYVSLFLIDKIHRSNIKMWKHLQNVGLMFWTSEYLREECFHQGWTIGVNHPGFTGH